MRAGLLNIDWENRLVYLFVDGLVSKNIILTPVFPAVNGYCSEDATCSAYVPGSHGKTILVLDLAPITEQYGIEQLEKLALSGAWTTKAGYSGYGFGDQYTFAIPVEGATPTTHPHTMKRATSGSITISSS